MEVIADSLQKFTKILNYTKKKDWVGIGLEISDELRTHGKLEDTTKNALRFARVLLSIYQAGSVEEGKKIFRQCWRMNRAGNADIIAIDGQSILAL